MELACCNKKTFAGLVLRRSIAIYTERNFQTGSYQNIVYQYNSLNFQTSSYQNIVYQYNSLNFQTSSYQNIVYQYNSLNFQTSSYQNIVYQYNSLIMQQFEIIFGSVSLVTSIRLLNKIKSDSKRMFTDA